MKPFSIFPALGTLLAAMILGQSPIAAEQALRRDIVKKQKLTLE